MLNPVSSHLFRRSHRLCVNLRRLALPPVKKRGSVKLSMFRLCTCSVLSVLLWPLVVYHELIQRMYTGLEPILMKLDYSMKGDTEHRKHDKRSECYRDTFRI